MKRIVLSVIMTLLAIQTVQAYFAGGLGTKNDPYKIETVTQLDSVRYFLASNFVLMNDLDFDGSTYAKANGGEGWIPIGTSSVTFSGHFNGKGHTISNLYINRSTDLQGLFGRTWKATLDSIHLRNVYVNANTFSGSLAGRTDGDATTHSIVSHCSSRGVVNGVSETGGLIGYARYSELYNCNFIGDVVTTGGRNGGLVGTNTGVGIIIDCYSSGSVSGSENIGGLVGMNFGIDKAIERSYSSAMVVATDNTAGGLVGDSYDHSTVINCYATGSVSSPSISGGLIGRNYWGPITTNCYSVGYISRTSSAGGLIGTNDGTVSSCYYDSTLSNKADIQKGNAKTTEEMMKASTFVNWEFDSIWKIDSAVTFPMLQKVYNGPLFTAIPQREFIHKDSLYTFDIDAIGMDNKNLTYSIESAPKTLKINSATGVIEWIVDSLGTLEVVYRVTDATGFYITGKVTLETHCFTGAGTTDNPYKIDDFEDLVAFTNNVTPYNRAMFVQTANINGAKSKSLNGGLGWLPINGFYGEYNGQGFVIDSLFSNRPIDSYIGLFGSLKGTVRNIGVTNVDFTGFLYVGGVTGFGNREFNTSNDSHIINCYSTGNVTAVGNSLNSAKYAGGIAGGKYYGTIKNCYSTVKVTGLSFVGGILGYSNSATISSCYYDTLSSTQHDNSGKGTPSSASSIRKKATFISWNFDSLWIIGEDLTFPKFYNSSPVITATIDSSMDEDDSLEIVESFVTVIDRDKSDLYRIIVKDGANYTTDGRKLFPNANFHGLLSVNVVATDGIDTSTTAVMQISVKPVNDAPVLIATINDSMNSASPFQITMQMVTATDSDNDELHIVILPGMNYSVSGDTIRTALTYIGDIGVNVAVTDGIDTSLTKTLIVNVSPNYTTSVEKLSPMAKDGYSLKVAPTPTKDNGQLLVVSDEGGKAVFTIYTKSAKKVAVVSKEIEANKEVEFNWDEISTLKPAVYFVEMKINGERKAISKIVKIKK